jgi:hypothetical protein
MSLSSPHSPQKCDPEIGHTFEGGRVCRALVREPCECERLAHRERSMNDSTSLWQLVFEQRLYAVFGMLKRSKEKVVAGSANCAEPAKRRPSPRRRQTVRRETRVIPRSISPKCSNEANSEQDLSRVRFKT